MPDRRPATTRRAFLREAGAGGAAALAAVLVDSARVSAAPQLWFQTSASTVAPPEQLHLQFGADASSEVAVSWATQTPVANPRLRLATAQAGFSRIVDADTRVYTDAQSGAEVYTQHARVDGLSPWTHYYYDVQHDGAAPVAGNFTTAPRSRSPFRFTSFGDQATPAPDNGLASANAAYNPPQVEQLQPLFHLFNGDLCYANISPDRVKTWRDFFRNNQVSARYRPWMPAAGNHENELGNGPYGFRSYQTRFSLPDNGEPNPNLRGMWYSFKAGSVRVISLNNDDVCYQDGGDSYVRGYSGGAQKAFLERTLKNARADPDIDWVVVCMHQVAMSSAANFNGADLGIRQEWQPLFDQYGVDLVVSGHEHHYERSLAVRGADPDSPTLRPHVVSTDTSEVDTSQGTVYMIIGGGGTSSPSNQLLAHPPMCEVIMSVGPQPATPPGQPRPKRAPNKVKEEATWVGTRDLEHPYGFASFDLDPGTPGGWTLLRVTLWDTAPSLIGTPSAFEGFVLKRPRRG
ncbi:MAG: metallophosphoesterase family protein [Chloroflexi bacterium]|nr:metallophosphoesterase family protein [Chloroflexota bacterium]